AAPARPWPGGRVPARARSRRARRRAPVGAARGPDPAGGGGHGGRPRRPAPGGADRRGARRRAAAAPRGAGRAAGPARRRARHAARDAAGGARRRRVPLARRDRALLPPQHGHVPARAHRDPHRAAPRRRARPPAARAGPGGPGPVRRSGAV
ncbi:MAG: hypothetical protein AVDCRST_MAG54-254, partial [uncultured Actinomycetospora sp.]